MSFETRSDRDIIIETATIVKSIQERMAEDDRHREMVSADIEERVRELERLRYMIWGAVVMATGSAVELARHVFLGGK